MEEKEKKVKKTGKKATNKIIMAILIPILIVVLVVSFVFSIFEAIIRIIGEILLGILEGLLDFLANPIEWVIKVGGDTYNFFLSLYNADFKPRTLELTQPKQLIIIGQDEFNQMKDQLDNSGVNRQLLGLDDIMLKKMLLTFNSGKYSHNADIIIQLTEEEIASWRRDTSLAEPFSVKLGYQIDQISMSLGETIADDIKKLLNNLFDREASLNQNRDKQLNYYLCTKGVLKFMCQYEGEEREMVYYNEDVLNGLYDMFERDRYGARKGYAESIWNYLSTCCYTDGDKGMKVYGHQTIKEELVEWSFEVDNPDLNSFKDVAKMLLDVEDAVLSNVAINKQMIDSKYLKYDAGGGLLDTAIKTYNWQDIDVYSLVAKYTTPVEFMVDLLELSNSKEFVNAFIEKVSNQTEVILKLYKIRNATSEEETEITKENIKVQCEALISAEIVAGYINKSLKVEEGEEIKQINVSEEITTGKEGIKYTYQWINNDTIRLTFWDIPGKYERLKTRVTFLASQTTKDVWVPGDQWLEGDPLDTDAERDITPSILFGLIDIGRYQYRENEAIIKQYTTKLTTETKLDMGVEYAKTWYGTVTYENDVIKKYIFEEDNNEDGVREDIPANRIKNYISIGYHELGNYEVINTVEGETVKIKGKKINITTYEENEKTGLIVAIEGQYENIKGKPGESVQVKIKNKDYTIEVVDKIASPNIKDVTKNTTTTTKNSSNADTIFKHNTIASYAFDEMGSRIEKWYANLEGDDIAFWLTPGGHLTHELYTRLDDNKGYRLSDYNEQMNIRFTYAMENGPAEWWINTWYLPVSMTITELDHKKGKIYETVKQELVQGVGTVREDPGFFLSLLKNANGEYDVDASYDARGKEIRYKDITGVDTNVGEKLRKGGGAEWLFDLLDRFPNTQSLVDIMRYILYKYNGTDYGITQWTFEIFSRDNMVSVNVATGGTSSTDNTSNGSNSSGATSTPSGGSGSGLNTGKPSSSLTQSQLR